MSWPYCLIGLWKLQVRFNLKTGLKIKVNINVCSHWRLTILGKGLFSQVVTSFIGTLLILLHQHIYSRPKNYATRARKSIFLCYFCSSLPVANLQKSSSSSSNISLMQTSSEVKPFYGWGCSRWQAFSWCHDLKWIDLWSLCKMKGWFS